MSENLEAREPTKGVSFKRSQEVIIGDQTKKVLVRVFPGLTTDQIKNQHPEKISVVTVAERIPTPKEPIATIGVPGLAFGNDSFMRQEEVLARFGAFVVCDYPVGPLNYELWLAQVNDTLEEQEKVGRKVVLMGNSMGGSLAAVVAKQHPGIVKGLILIHTPGSPEELSETRLKHLYRLAEGAASRENGLLARSAAVAYTRFFNRSLSGIPDNLPLKFQQRWEKGVRLNPEAVRTRALATIRAIKEIGEYQGSVSSVPTLMVGSERDHFLPSFSPHLKKLFPNSTEVLVSISHGDILQQPKEVNRLMSDWLKETFT